MKHGKRGAVVLMLVAVVNLGFADTGSWQKSMGGILEPQINSILPDPQDNHLIYAGTEKALYLSTDQGRTYRPILQIQGSDKSINCIYKQPWGKHLYAATGSGVYATDNAGLSWTNIFSPSEAEARQCFAVYKEKDVLYVGTLGGVYRKGGSGAVWHRESGDLGNEPIYQIDADEQYIYFAADRRIFRKKKDGGGEVKVIFDAGLAGEDSAEEGAEDEAGLLPRRHIKDFVVADSVLYAANDGVSYSRDQGQTWQSLPVVGLTPTSAITAVAVDQNNAPSHGTGDVILTSSSGAGQDLDPSPRQEDEARLRMTPQDLISRGVIYAGTIQGVFKFAGTRWVPLYKGMETNAVNDLVKAGPGPLYAATSQGVFYLADEAALTRDVTPADLNVIPAEAGIHKMTPEFYENISRRFEDEPSIQDVQRLAIAYAEVHPSKIEQWRRGAKYRALLPTLSAGLDRDATERFHWDSGGTPDRLLEGRDFMDWDLSVSWDLADLIWNPDQTSIDSRSKMMVELREDIMDQVTRLYFERRRVQVEAAAAEKSAVMDPQVQFDRQLRVAELTALIDSLTGGRFSERIENSRHSEAREASRRISK